MRIQHNILAMNAYRNYNTNTSALSKNLEKLSSGYKINRAGDDAAGLAISEKMRAQITGLNAASKNVKDGISLVKTAEGAMQEIQDMLNRMDYLATQSANGTYDNEIDRMNLNKEMDALKSEIDRIAESANFNGIKLLDGSLMDDPVVSKTVTVEETKDLTSLTTTATCCQFHKAGVASQQATFEIDLKQALHGAKASGSIAAGGSFSLKVNVGGATLTLKFKVDKALSSGAIIGPGNVELLSIATAGGGTIATAVSGEVSAAAGSISLTSGSATGTFKVSVENKVLKFEMTSSKAAKDFNSNMAVTIRASGGITMNVNGSANTGGDASGVVSYNCSTQNPVNGVAKKASQLAHVHINASEIVQKINAGIANGQGGVLTIGNNQVQFLQNTDKTDTWSVGIKDLLDSDGNLKTDTKSQAELARRISQAANKSDIFTVGVGSDGNKISFEEKYNYAEGITDTKDAKFLGDEAKIKAVLNWGVTAKQDASSGTGQTSLTLQIGDTSDNYNRLKVSIGDMHVKAMGQELDDNGKNTGKGKSIADIDIKSPEGAAEAISVIKNAINYVSSVRGDLGATQNRLEHTANNLSVMAENIQDAESTIRDTDVAEEMMSYTKNNILVQSAQAMLAQANAVPQGVLQLLG